MAILVWSNRDRIPAYRWLGIAPLVGVAAQALIGGVIVLLHLHPAWVSLHFLVSMLLVVTSTPSDAIGAALARLNISIS